MKLKSNNEIDQSPKQKCTDDFFKISFFFRPCRILKRAILSNQWKNRLSSQNYTNLCFFLHCKSAKESIKKSELNGDNCQKESNGRDEKYTQTDKMSYNHMFVLQ